MEKRLTFQCWNCTRNYSLLIKVEGWPKITVECPYCNQEGVVDFHLFRSETVKVFRDDPAANEAGAPTLNLPEVIPTHPVEA
jgi:hypothetical protein